MRSVIGERQRRRPAPALSLGRQTGEQGSSGITMFRCKFIFMILRYDVRKAMQVFAVPNPTDLEPHDP